MLASTDRPLVPASSLPSKHPAAITGSRSGQPFNGPQPGLLGEIDVAERQVYIEELLSLRDITHTTHSPASSASPRANGRASLSSHVQQHGLELLLVAGPKAASAAASTAITILRAHWTERHCARSRTEHAPYILRYASSQPRSRGHAPHSAFESIRPSRRLWEL